MTARLPVNSLATEYLPPMGDYSAICQLCGTKSM